MLESALKTRRGTRAWYLYRGVKVDPTTYQTKVMLLIETQIATQNSIIGEKNTSLQDIIITYTYLKSVCLLLNGTSELFSTHIKIILIFMISSRITKQYNTIQDNTNKNLHKIKISWQNTDNVHLTIRVTNYRPIATPMGVYNTFNTKPCPTMFTCSALHRQWNTIERTINIRTLSSVDALKHSNFIEFHAQTQLFHRVSRSNFWSRVFPWISRSLDISSTECLFQASRRPLSEHQLPTLERPGADRLWGTLNHRTRNPRRSGQSTTEVELLDSLE